MGAAVAAWIVFPGGLIFSATARPLPLFVVPAFEGDFLRAVAEDTMVEPFAVEVFVAVCADLPA